jgi:hypothetical protein
MKGVGIQKLAGTKTLSETFEITSPKQMLDFGKSRR